MRVRVRVRTRVRVAVRVRTRVRVAVRVRARDRVRLVLLSNEPDRVVFGVEHGIDHGAPRLASAREDWDHVRAAE